MRVPDIWRKEGEFGPWLAERLRQERISQRRLGQLAEIDHSTISRLTKGDREPHLRTAIRILEVLDGRQR